MKKSLLLAGMLAVGLANAQTGKVGINTENPNETLEINGTLRVDNLPESGVGKIYDGADTTGTTFTGTRTLVADEKGNIGYSAGSSSLNIPFGKALVGGDGVNALTSRDYLTSALGRTINETLRTGEFYLEKTSLVFFNVAVTNSINAEEVVYEVDRNGNQSPVPLYDDKTKRYGFSLALDGTNIMNPMVPVTFNDISGADHPFPKGQTVGQFQVMGSRVMVLEGGKTYTYQLNYRFQKHNYDQYNYKLTVGNGSTNILDIVAIPIEQ